MQMVVSGILAVIALLLLVSGSCSIKISRMDIEKNPDYSWIVAEFGKFALWCGVFMWTMGVTLGTLAVCFFCR